MFAPPVAKSQTKAAAGSTNKLMPPRSTLMARPPGHGSVEQAQVLQRLIGNQALPMLLAQRAQSLIGNQRGDRHEQEADRVADQIMRMPDPKLSITAGPPQLSRKCAPCEEEEKTRTLQAKRPEMHRASAEHEAPEIVHEVLRSPGHPLDKLTRTFFEPRFGYDFSQVKVHSDTNAAESARAVNALAYVVGQDVVFGAEQYAPGTREGQRLLAHELSHVVQQRGSALTKLVVGTPDTPCVQKAEHVANPLPRRQQAAPLTLSERIVRRDAEERKNLVPSGSDLKGTSWVNLDDPDGHVASVYFSTNQTSLDDLDKRALATVYNTYEKYLQLKKVQMLFIGYADYRGAEKFNKSLGIQRAEAVAKYFSPLMILKPSNYSFGISSAGESEAPQVGRTSSELSPYRRVDIIASPAKTTPKLKATEQVQAGLLKFQDCDREGGMKERMAIADSYQTAISRIDRTLTFLDGPLTYKAGALGQQLNMFFSQPIPTAPSPRASTPKRPRILVEFDVESLNYIRHNYEKLRTSLVTETLIFECDYRSDINFICREEVYAVGSWNIHICPAFFEASPDEQARTLVHECMHKWVLGGGHPEDNLVRNPFAYDHFLRD
jgi:outer membrane protein OmpA-like peptidoglycan-associated protein